MALAAFSGQINQVGWRQAVAAAGQYYTITNPTPGTGILCGTVTAFSATADGLYTISNNSPVNGGKTIQLDMLKLDMSGTAPTATTVMKMAAFVEQGIVAPSAGNSVVVAKNVNPAGPGSVAVINQFVSAMCTIPAAVGTRTLVGNWSIPTSLGVTGDTYTTLFGADPAAFGALTAVRATAPANLVVAAPPITIPPQSTCIIDWWWVGQATNGPTFEPTLTWLEY